MKNRINFIIALIYAIIVIITAFIRKDFTFLISLPYIIIPFIIKIPKSLTTIYLIFGFLCLYLGNSMHLFKTTTWFDSFTHFLWGIIASFAAIYILKIFKMWKEDNLFFNLLFIFVFALASFGLWEVIEFIGDNLFNMDVQRRATGVFDTMKDIIVALLGNLLFLIWFYYEYKENHKLLIRKLINTFSV